jgi:cation:H+ antiporter
MAFIAIIVGIVLLIKGGDWLMRSAVSMSLKLNIPKIVIGMTVVSFATSAPELIVSIRSALLGHPDLALGNVIGSNIANLGLVLAITIIISPINVNSNFYKTDWPMMISATILFFLFIFFDHKLTSIEGLIMFVLLISFLFYLIFFQKETVDEISENKDVLSITQISYYLLAGGFSLWLGSETLIKGAVALALDNGVSERIISVSIISIGTSIPELSASIIAVINKEKAISIGNLIGSNIFNLLAVLGITSIIAPVSVVDMGLLDNDLWWMIGISFLILPLVFVFKRNQLSKIEGVILLSVYISFIYPLISK